MIKTEKEYRGTLGRIAQGRELVAKQRQEYERELQSEDQTVLDELATRGAWRGAPHVRAARRDDAVARPAVFDTRPCSAVVDVHRVATVAL